MQACIPHPLLIAAMSLAISAVAPWAVAAPGGDPPGSQSFPSHRRQVDALDARSDDLERAAPRPGIMWVDPREIQTGRATVSVDRSAPGLLVTAGRAGTDVAIVGLQVPPGFVLTGATVCYVTGPTGSAISNAQVRQLRLPLRLRPDRSARGSTGSAAPTGTRECVDADSFPPVDPRLGGSMFLSLVIGFTAAEPIAIRTIGLHLQPGAR